MILNLLGKTIFTLLFLSINAQASEDESLEGECIDEPLSITKQYSPRKIFINGATPLKYWKNNKDWYNSQNEEILKKVSEIFVTENKNHPSNQTPFKVLEFYKCIISKKLMRDICTIIAPYFHGHGPIFYKECMYLSDIDEIYEIIKEELSISVVSF